MALGWTITIIGSLITVVTGYFMYKFVKDVIGTRLVKTFDKKTWIKYVGLDAAFGIGLALVGVGAFQMNPEWTVDKGKNMTFLIVGLLFFGISILWALSSLWIRKGRKDLEGKTKKILDWTCVLSVIPTVIFFCMFLDGLAPYQNFPLYKGVRFSDGVSFIKAGDNIGSFHIAWYGLIILSGVIVAYLISDYKIAQEYGKHGLIDTLVLIAFPAGVIGARIWYVVGNYERNFAGKGFAAMLRISDGGLTILGGAFAGVLVGYLFVRRHRKFMDPLVAADAVVPTVLLAQAIGRWGNYFNCEVYGRVVNVNDGWNWLPLFIQNQMNVSNNGVHLPAGQIHVPLFLIEGMLNVLGYILIVYVYDKLCNKIRAKGDNVGLYFLWYGVVRIILEPLRDTQFNMGSDNDWSIINSLVYIILGVSIILIVHLKVLENKKAIGKPIVTGLSSLFAFSGIFFCFMPSLSQGRIITSDKVEAIQKFGGFDLMFSGQATPQMVAFILLIIGGLTMLLTFVKPLRKYEKWLYLASSLLFLTSVIIFLGGSSWTSLPKKLGDKDVTYSLSYGFTLTGLFSLIAFMLSYMQTKPYFKKDKKDDKVVIDLTNE